ncbi:MAG TPA: FAD binding domain-containing protein [Alphaproteobacteria bacterium]|nr:FAD binding domain-containing protein [Alphaproteobacteria bacterium]
MKPASFDYFRPDTAAEALALLAEHGEEARVIAGGQSLMALLNLRLAAPRALVDIARLDDLDYCRQSGGFLEVGAACTQARLLEHRDLAQLVPLLAQALPHVGHFQTRNRGTVCGSLAHGDPSSELPLCLATLEGEVVLRSVRGERVLKAAEFQTGLLATAREPDELVVAARYPLKRPGAGYAFAEVARRHGDFAIVSLAAVAHDGMLRLGVGGVADRPTAREWRIVPDDSEDVLNAFAWELGGGDDIHASARYRRDIVRKLGRKVLEEAAACAS